MQFMWMVTNLNNIWYYAYIPKEKWYMRYWDVMQWRWFLCIMNMKCSSQATLKLEYLFQEKDNQCSKPIRIGLENIFKNY